MIERRFVPARDVRVAQTGKSASRIEGYAALFNSRSEDLGGFVEVIAPGAFSDAIKHSDIRALWNHNPNYVLGRTKSGTLTVTEDAIGLHIANTPPNAQWARDLLESIGRGDVDQMSFGFIVASGGATWREEGRVIVRTITKVAKLLDVSPVTYPAYEETSVKVRATSDWRAQIETFRRRHKQALID